MAVQIPISANASAVTAAFAEIRDAIEKAGQAGRSLQSLDLSHPELAKFAADLQLVQQRLAQIARTGIGPLAATVRSFTPAGGSTNVFGPGGLLSGGLAARFPGSPGAVNQTLNQLGATVLPGTRWAPPPRPVQPPAQPAPGGPPPAQPPAGLGSIFAGASSMSMSVLGPVLSMVGIGSLGAMAAHALQLAQSEGIAGDTLIRRINDTAGDFDGLRKGIDSATKGLGITGAEGVRVASIWARMAGDQTPESAIAGMRLGTGFGRAFGVEPEMGAATLGKASFLGEDPRRFALMLGEAMQKGGQGGQIEQVTQAFMRALEDTSKRVVDNVGIQASLAGFSGLYAAMNAGGDRMGLAGLRGENASSIISTLNQSVTQGGNAGTASAIFTARAFAAEGVKNPYEVEDIRERGMFAAIRPGGPTVLQANLSEANREYGNQGDPFRFRHIMERQFGLTHPQTMALQKVFGEDLQGMAGAAPMTETFDRLQKAGIDIMSPGFNPSSMQDLVSIASKQNPADLEGFRTELANRAGPGGAGKALNAGEQTALAGASGEGLRDMLLSLNAKYGQAPTEASLMRDATAQLTTALTELGQLLVVPLTSLISDTTALIKATEAGWAWLKGTWIFAGASDLTPDQIKQEYEGPSNPNLGVSTPTQWLNNLLGLGGRPGAPSGPLENITDSAQQDRIRQAISFFQSPGGGSFSRAGALGITEGGMAESGLGKTSQNIFQWTDAARIKSIEDHAGKKISEMSYQEQLEAHAWELTQGPEHAAGEALRGAPTPYEAGRIDTMMDERPAAKLVSQFDRGYHAAGLDRQFPAGVPPPALVAADPLHIVIHTPDGQTVHHDLPLSVSQPTPNNAPNQTTTGPMVRPSQAGPPPPPMLGPRAAPPLTIFPQPFP